MVTALEWKYAESELSQQFQGSQWEDEFNYIQRLISDYILANFTSILYIDQPGGNDYLFNQINAFINSTNIRDGYKDLYTILLKLPKYSFDGSDLTPIYNELESFVDNTDAINSELKDGLAQVFQFVVDGYNNSVSNAETKFWLEAREYLNSLNLAPTTRAWFEANIEQTNMTSFIEFSELFNPRTSVIQSYLCGVPDVYCNYTETIYGDYNLKGLQNFVLLLIDVVDKDDLTFGNFTGPFWPNNLIENANRIASSIEYLRSNSTEEEFYKFTNAVFESITDMYEFEYPMNALLNITAQVSSKILSPQTNNYYFGEQTYVDGYFNYTTFESTPGYYVRGPGHTEEFVKDVLLIMEDTLDNTMNMRDIIDTAQLYVEMNTFNVTTVDGVIDFICDQTKDITKELCMVLEMVNVTRTLIFEFLLGFSNFTYKNSITDVVNTIHLPEYLPFLEDLVDALVSTFYPNEGATIISSFEATRQYWTSTNITSNNIINLIESIGNLYLLDDIALQNRWKYTILYVEEIFNNTDIILNSDIDELINILKGITTSPTSPTYMPSISPSKTPTSYVNKITTITPSITPTLLPSMTPSILPSKTPTSYPSKIPTITPSITPTLLPSMTPSISPSKTPTSYPSKIPTITPSITPTLLPSMTPTKKPTLTPTLIPTSLTKMPSWSPTIPGETRSPSLVPTKKTDTPTIHTTSPTSPTYMPSISPSKTPTSYPSKMPTITPSITPTLLPSMTPSILPSKTPTSNPSKMPTITLSITPTLLPSMTPTKKPTLTPTLIPTIIPTSLTKMPSWSPTISGETRSPSLVPTKASDTPSIHTNSPTMEPTTINDVTNSSNGSSYQFYSIWLCFIFVLIYFVF